MRVAFCALFSLLAAAFLLLSISCSPSDVEWSRRTQGWLDYGRQRCELGPDTLIAVVAGDDDPTIERPDLYTAFASPPKYTCYRVLSRDVYSAKGPGFWNGTIVFYRYVLVKKPK